MSAQGPVRPGAPLLEVRDLHVTLSGKKIIDGVSLSVERGRSLGIVGESGSGKSVTVLSATGLLDAPRTEISGTAAVDGRPVIGASPQALRQLHGPSVGFVFQDPATSLNPLLTLERQLTEGPQTHLGLTRRQARSRALELLDAVGLPDPESRLEAYPHQLSGGQKQRVMIAVALACDPALLVADEPTTALDVTTQAQILQLVNDLKRDRDMSVVWISHDLGVIGQIADDVAVLYQGQVVEHAPVKDIFDAPQHDYTRTLLAARPRLGAARDLAAAPAGDDAPLLQISDMTVDFELRTSTGKKTVRANEDVTLHVRRGETLGIVGESGSGKSTIANVLTGLVTPVSGEVLLEGEDIIGVKGRTAREVRRRIAMVFQDPYAALNPRRSVAASLAEALGAAGWRGSVRRGVASRDGNRSREGSAASMRDRGAELLESVNLDGSFLDRYPHELSGGQRQRVCIARALALDPEVLILDESTASLDVSIQSQVIELLRRLQAEHGFAYLFIAHDLAVVEQMSHRIAVMKDGRVVEENEATELYRAPRQQYTRDLIAAIPPERPS
ncbi:dipeptide ABC transporter ATP-binding protein [Sediminivirga luteola]|uniref:ABC transporter ATP-binding protein n=1 Tax=Sediminivirga luteola TaxID=1774748 RepID=A0A8J2TX20_9MICO|nr:ABC transporter ATP-binding protein [Sediminivirga luteola]MCI2265481.1 ABC transporter ATP-binding protein [Sediminivirga luteola]GGA10296.1 ABC transporter ATP-binding protein [Sediminivirga luteola]